MREKAWPGLTMRRAVPAQILREDHDVAGFTFGVIGAFYGVVLAFVIVAAWQRFERADEETQNEALGLTNMDVLSRGCEDPMRSDMIAAVRKYASEVVNREWDAMAQASFQKSMDSEQNLWKVLLTYNPKDSRDQILLGKCLDGSRPVIRADDVIALGDEPIGDRRVDDRFVLDQEDATVVAHVLQRRSPTGRESGTTCEGSVQITPWRSPRTTCWSTRRS